MAMELNAIIEEMQGCIFSLQQRVEELKGMDDKSAETILLLAMLRQRGRVTLARRPVPRRTALRVRRRLRSLP